MGGTTYYIDHDRLVLAGTLFGLVFAYWAYLKAADAKRGAWAAYEEIHSHRTQVEEDPHGDEFDWSHGDDGSDE